MSARAQRDAGLSQGLGVGEGRNNHHLLAPSSLSQLKWPQASSRAAWLLMLLGKLLVGDEGDLSIT